MKLLLALQSVLSAEPHGLGHLRWQIYLYAALAGVVAALAADLAGHLVVGFAFNIVSVLLLGFVLAGITSGVRRELKGPARA
ncbi:MAG TPA: hypothetical protein VF867_05560 [Arthrobacter sp.]